MLRAEVNCLQPSWWYHPRGSFLGIEHPQQLQLVDCSITYAAISMGQPASLLATSQVKTHSLNK